MQFEYKAFYQEFGIAATSGPGHSIVDIGLLSFIEIDTGRDPRLQQPFALFGVEGRRITRLREQVGHAHSQRPRSRNAVSIADRGDPCRPSRRARSLASPSSSSRDADRSFGKTPGRFSNERLKPRLG